MKIDNVNKIVYVRQSWLNDMVICPERARLGIVRPDFRTGSDATIIGTAIHAGIESVLDGKSSDYGQMLNVVGDNFDILKQTNYKKTNIYGGFRHDFKIVIIPVILSNLTARAYSSVGRAADF